MKQKQNPFKKSIPTIGVFSLGLLLFTAGGFLLHDKVFSQSEITNIIDEGVVGIENKVEYISSLKITDGGVVKSEIKGDGVSMSGSLQVTTAVIIGTGNKGEPDSFIGGGKGNTAVANAGIGGGSGNTVTGTSNGVVLGGVGNTILGATNSILGGGRNNTITGTAIATIIGGEENTSSKGGIILGMTGNVNDGGANVVIAGTNTKVGNAIDNVFVWSDKATGFSPTTPKTFYINTQGGVGINTNNPQVGFDSNGAIKLGQIPDKCTADNVGVIGIKGNCLCACTEAGYWTSMVDDPKGTCVQSCNANNDCKPSYNETTKKRTWSENCPPITPKLTCHEEDYGFPYCFDIQFSGASAVNGVCGSANGTTVSTKPTSNLCSVGTASPVAGSGPWTWTCNGSNGGINASCKAINLINGVCGSANGTTVSTKPTSNLCSVGTASPVAGSGPWTWTCAGSNGGTAASCNANKTVTYTCQGSVPTNATLCVGSNSGLTANTNNTVVASCGTTKCAYTCNAGYILQNGVCIQLSTSCYNNYTAPTFWQSASEVTQGSSISVGNGKYLGRNGSTLYIPWSIYAGHSGKINGSLNITATITCGAGTYANTTGTYKVTVDSNNPITQITLNQYYNGYQAPSDSICTLTNVQMTATFPPICDGICGSANGTTVSTKPTSNLCSVGTASSVTGSGPWTWTCNGSNGGAAASCSANKTVTYTCQGSVPTNATLCGGSNTGLTANTNNTVVASCGTTKCAYTCKSDYTLQNGVCAKQISGTCGSAHNTETSTKPTSNLCSAGTASSVEGSGPWTWTCNGSNGGTYASCSANVTVQLPTIRVKILAGTTIGFTNYSSSNIKNYDVQIGGWIGHPNEFRTNGGIYYYTSTTDSMIDVYPGLSSSLIFQLPTIDNSAIVGIIKDWYSSPYSLSLRSTTYPNSNNSLSCNHTSQTYSKGGKLECYLDYYILKSEAEARGGLPDASNIIELEIGGPSNSSSPGYEAPFGLQNNIDSGD